MDDYVINISFRDFQSQAPRPRIPPRLKSAHLLLGFPYYCLFGYWESLGKENMFIFMGKCRKNYNFLCVQYCIFYVLGMFGCWKSAGKDEINDTKWKIEI